jgi:hypothetical protein
MSQRRARSIVAALVLLGALIYVSSRAQTQAPFPVLVLVSAATGAGDISLGVLRSAFENQPTEYRGNRLLPFNLPPGDPARVLFDKVVLRLAADRIGAYWIDQKIRTGMSPPRSVNSHDMLLRVIASLKGAIGYAQMNPHAVPLGIVALTVEGKSPTDPAYPLK